jgi:hypothetical protein
VSAPELALEFRFVHRRAAADVAAAGLRVELVVGGAVGTGVGAVGSGELVRCPRRVSGVAREARFVYARRPVLQVTGTSALSGKMARSVHASSTTPLHRATARLDSQGPSWMGSKLSAET